MSWAKIRVGSGVLKIKPRRQMRRPEREHLVPMLDLGIIVISWWDAATLRAEDKR